jgi:hypothetical protein
MNMRLTARAVITAITIGFTGLVPDCVDRHSD